MASDHLTECFPGARHQLGIYTPWVISSFQQLRRGCNHFHFTGEASGESWEVSCPSCQKVVGWELEQERHPKATL